ncbi:hydroxymethylpyrimidine/phosphomethylpyrimidine kinase [Ichthyobacterium seriolicida]|uniref:hydroxymethylpyrimidine kinase n=1 Tax=Ichthyobacterium seriolicida TaxID=242600 RepID=A0A1J1E4L9_9FLAO|nr:hydroxymethylpyrimidine/phosphomethylpyrimidine kinase [Ichthyobacterium seriolicida]BAV94996.1 phosphomethylpyrimidine kinase [Ichthyobacterium seriolicida]
MPRKRPFVLTIAGLDPSASAGVYSDIKTFESLKVYGLAVPTANTLQTEKDFIKANWIPTEQIIEQLQLILDNYSIKFAKIGIVEDLQILTKIIDIIYDKGINIILDPILKSSSGFSFHKEDNYRQLIDVFGKCFLITPNYNEITSLFEHGDIESEVLELSKKTNILIKGGHNISNIGRDFLYSKDKKYTFAPKKTDITEKHGSGCVFSAAVTAYLSRGFSLHRSCLKAKSYTERFLNSNKSLLGWHK